MGREVDTVVWLAVLVVWLVIYLGLCALLIGLGVGRVEYGAYVLGLGLMYPVFVDSSPVWYWVFGFIAVVISLLYAVGRTSMRLPRSSPTVKKTTNTVV